MTGLLQPAHPRVRAGFARLVPVLFLGIGLLVLPGCINEERERQLGDEMAATVNRQIALVRNPLLNAYVTSLGDAVASVSDRPELDYHFYIINSASVNAFALPGGHVYLTRGLIERTTSGGELAAVLAHEIGHVVRRHGVEKLERHLRTGSLVNVLYSIILGGEPELLRQNATRLAGFLWNASNSREDEQEADRLAVEYLIRYGVDPESLVSLLQSLLQVEAQDTSNVAAAWFSSHPLTGSRITETQQEIASQLRAGETPAAPEPAQDFPAYPAFLRLIAALPPPPDAE